MTAQCRNQRSCVAWDGVLGLAADTRLDGGPLCDGCLARAGADIRALPRDHLALTAELTPAGRPRDAYVSGGDPEAPVPLSLHVDELQRRIVWTVTVWDPPLSEALGRDPAATRGVRASWVVTNACALIANHVRVLAALPPTWGYADGLDAGPVERDGIYAVEQLRALHRVAERVLGVHRVTRTLPGMCRACGKAGALLREDGSDRVRCAGCGASEDFELYRAAYGMRI